MLANLLILFEPVAKWVALFIGIFDLVGVLFLLSERFGPAKGRLASAVASVLPSFVFGPFKNSLRELKAWHVDTKREEKLRALGKPIGSSEKDPFSYWMVEDIVRNYENNAQGIAYLGAALLIFIIGLRGVRQIGDGNKWLIIVALALEFTLIGLLGLLLFYKPEDEKPRGSNESIQAELDKVKADLELKDKSLKDLQIQVQQSIKELEHTRFVGLETRVNQSIREMQLDVDSLRAACEASKKNAGTP